MKYIEEKEEAIKFIENKIDKAFGLMQFENKELYQLAKKEYDVYCTIMEIIEEQQKEIDEKDKKIEKLLNIKLYACDIEKNKECSKRNCYINGGPCSVTINKEKAKYIDLDNYISKETVRKLYNEYSEYIKVYDEGNYRRDSYYYKRLKVCDVLKELLGE